MTMQVLTANRLSDGVVVYLSDDEAWVEAISEASISRTDRDETKLLRAGSRSVVARLIVDPYLIEVNQEESAIRPRRFREVIRAGGPTVETVRPAPVPGT